MHGVCCSTQPTTHVKYTSAMPRKLTRHRLDVHVVEVTNALPRDALILTASLHRIMWQSRTSDTCLETQRACVFQIYYGPTSLRLPHPWQDADSQNWIFDMRQDAYQ